MFYNIGPRCDQIFNNHWNKFGHTVLCCSTVENTIHRCLILNCYYFLFLYAKGHKVFNILKHTQNITISYHYAFIKVFFYKICDLLSFLNRAQSIPKNVIDQWFCSKMVDGVCIMFFIISFKYFLLYFFSQKIMKNFKVTICGLPVLTLSCCKLSLKPLCCCCFCLIYLIS